MLLNSRHLIYPGMYEMVEYRLREPVLWTEEQLHERIDTEGDFALIMNDLSLHKFITLHLRHKKHYVIKESFGRWG